MRNTLVDTSFIFISLQKMKKKVEMRVPSPPSFKGRRWGKYPSFVIFSFIVAPMQSLHGPINAEYHCEGNGIIDIFLFSCRRVLRSEVFKKTAFRVGKWSAEPGKLISVSEKTKYDTPLHSTLQHDNGNKSIIPLHPRWNSALIDRLHFSVGSTDDEKSASLTSFL